MSSKKKMSLINNLIQIVKLSEENGLTKKLFEKAAPYIDAVNEKLHISKIQSVFFAQFIKQFNDQSITVNDIIKDINISSADMLEYLSDIDELIEKKLIVRNSRKYRNNITYYVPQHIVDIIRKNEEVFQDKRSDLDISDFFAVLEEIIEQRSEDETDYDFFITEVQTLLNENKHLPFSKKIKKLSLDDNNVILFMICCHQFVNHNSTVDLSDLKDIYDRKVFLKMKRSLIIGENELIQKNYINYTKKNGLFKTVDEYELTDYAKDEFLDEFKIQEKIADRRKDIIKFDSITAKQMFYNEREQAQISQLINLLTDDSLTAVQGRLKKNGMRTGFNRIFSGLPGTGKTETVYQIAQKTKRDIMAIDISNTKSMWYGESEKKIKKVFQEYRDYVENSDRTPILLLNEADAVLGKRNEFNNSSRSVDQTANAIQNIILQELENLNGIMIATTNLTQNLDKAFERRFLYKIEFEKPVVEVRKELWKSMLPGLNNSDAKKLAEKFEFSGGQMENIGRKKSVSTILNGKKLLLPDIIKLCEEENYTKQKSSRPIGFVF